MQIIYQKMIIYKNILIIFTNSYIITNNILSSIISLLLSIENIHKNIYVLHTVLIDFYLGQGNT